ncbi:unnamed protein product [Protopolystoma xenopodis]|uniref:DOP1-like C-terminal domain-containing protein n=1 Tax=Protopolystoma xenopodis TaxID=117903 RepID=A0A3S5BXD1_9PLAT|nr:unnamed protein product [Protopolystoma xenopodis]
MSNSATNGFNFSLHAQIFLFSRVLLSRLSACHLTSVWHLVIPELIQVFRTLLDQLHDA